MHLRLRGELRRARRSVGSFVPEVELLAHCPLELGQEPLVGVVREGGRDEPREEAERAQVGRDLLLQVRVLHLDRHLLAAKHNRAMHLSQRR